MRRRPKLLLWTLSASRGRCARWSFGLASVLARPRSAASRRRCRANGWPGRRSPLDAALGAGGSALVVLLGELVWAVRARGACPRALLAERRRAAGGMVGVDWSDALVGRARVHPPTTRWTFPTCATPKAPSATTYHADGAADDVRARRLRADPSRAARAPGRALVGPRARARQLNGRHSARVGSPRAARAGTGVTGRFRRVGAERGREAWDPGRRGARAMCATPCG